MKFLSVRASCRLAVCVISAFWIGAAQAQAGDNALLLRQAGVYVEAERYKDAVAILRTLEPRSREEELDVSLLTGKIYLAIDRPAKALEFFEDAEAQSLESFDATIGLANANLRLGQFKQARRLVQTARKLNPDSSEPDLILAAVALRTGNPTEAKAQMQALLTQRPDSEGVAIAYAKYLVLTGDNTAAKRSAERFMDRYASAASVRDYLADVEFKTGNVSAALAYKGMAAALYEKQGNTFRRDVAYAWLAVNGGAARIPQVVVPPAPLPEVAPPMPLEVATPPRAGDAASQQGRATKSPVAVAPERDFSPPVQRFPFPAGVMITGGSGFIVDSGRKIVTNRHVVEGGKEFAVRTGLGEIIKARLLFLSPTDDIAVLELEKPLPADRAIPANAYAKPGVGRNVVVMGYPLWSVLGEGSPSLTNGMVSKRTGLQDDKGTFQLTAKVNKGNSGGPVFDLSGHVVGITVGKLDTKKFQDDQGFIPEDVNFAIHVDRLPPIANIQLGNNPQAGPELGTEELYQAMLGKVVMVATYK
jgi:S1-C subfamily serine protease